jgi:hypothetical protein
MSNTNMTQASGYNIRIPSPSAAPIAAQAGGREERAAPSVAGREGNGASQDGEIIGTRSCTDTPN